MRYSIFAVFLLLLSGASLAIDQGVAFEDPELQARYKEITSLVRCLTCQNQTVKDSNSLLAGELRREIREQIANGNSDAEIYEFLTARYGEFALYKPPFNARNLILWIAPPGLLLIAAFVVAGVLRKRSHLSLEDEKEHQS